MGIKHLDDMMLVVKSVKIRHCPGVNAAWSTTNKPFIRFYGKRKITLEGDPVYRNPKSSLCHEIRQRISSRFGEKSAMNLNGFQLHAIRWILTKLSLSKYRG